MKDIIVFKTTHYDVIENKMVTNYYKTEKAARDAATLNLYGKSYRLYSISGRLLDQTERMKENQTDRYIKTTETYLGKINSGLEEVQKALKLLYEMK